MSAPAGERPAPPGPANAWHAVHVRLLAESHARVVGRALCGDIEPEAVFEADFVLLSHGTESDPIFDYANRLALELFELDWARFVRTPSRESAEPAKQAERERFMRRVREHGYVDDYSGVRVSSSGKRFVIEQATVWNVVDADGVLRGQAATFRDWRSL